MRIALIGPAHPFRGGLVHHTTLLYRHLRREHHTTFYAFTRQYPKWLFRGRTDRDSSANPLVEEGVQKILDSCNPLTWWSVCQSIKDDHPDLLIIPWWTSFWTPQFWTIATAVKRYTSTRILFICHNVVDHESHPLSHVCARAVLSKGDHLVVHSESDRQHLQSLLPTARIARAYHPIYDFFNTGMLTPLEAKAKLGLQGEVILFFGFIRPYKGVEDLLRAMPSILKRRCITLLVVGEFWHGRAEFSRLIRMLQIEAAVRVVDRYVPNEEVGLYFTAADLVVLPYASGTGSGIAQIAWGFDKPIVATRVGSLPEVVEDGQTGYLVNPGDAAALADAVVRFFAEDKEAEFVTHIKRTKARFSWARLVQLIETLVGGDGPPQHTGSCTPQ